ncbi:polygalacturonase-like [Nymphaea colorata]|nr:polygalacturonase-like [Nymphaea colorata]
MATHPQPSFSIFIFIFTVGLLSADKCCCIGFNSDSFMTRKVDCCTRETEEIQRAEAAVLWSSKRRGLAGGPGSYPPHCSEKCGDCSPCKPVHVAVPPGAPVIAEYYPEAWRCKCGNKLYMP